MPIIDNVYDVKQEIGLGGMAKVYLAEVDLNKFDYTQLYGYTQVKENVSHFEKLQKAKEMVKKLTVMKLDPETVKNILEVQGIPIPDKKVALKIANNTTSSQDVEDERFRGEWEHLICLNHRNVIKVYGGGVYKKRSYYAMEYLENLIRPKVILNKFPIKIKIQIIMQAGMGLAYLHNNGIIHRDVKPSNFITVKNGNNYETKVTDLGMAKSSEEDLGMTTDQSFIGTPYFMSPEQVKSAKDVDHRTDIYSLGASLYELMTGVKPYNDKTSVYEIIEATAKGEGPKPPDRIVENIPAPLRDILNCSMAKSVKFRYQHMDEFIKDLDTFLKTDGQILNLDMDFSNYKPSDISGEYIYKKYNELREAALEQSRIAKLQKKKEQKRKKKLTKEEQLFEEHYKSNNKIAFGIVGGVFFVIVLLVVVLSLTDKENDPIEVTAQPEVQKNSVEVIDNGVGDEKEESRQNESLTVLEKPKVEVSEEATPVKMPVVEENDEKNPETLTADLNTENAKTNDDNSDFEKTDVVTEANNEKNKAEEEPPESVEKEEPETPQMPEIRVGELADDILALMNGFHQIEQIHVPKIEDLIQKIAQGNESAKDDSTKKDNKKINLALKRYDSDVDRARSKFLRVLNFELSKAMRLGKLKEANRLQKIKDNLEK